MLCAPTAIAMICCKLEPPKKAFPAQQEHRQDRKASTWPLLCSSSLIQHKCIWGFMGFLEAASEAQGLFLGLLFSHLFLFILFHHGGPIVGHKNVTGTIGRTCCLQDCSEGRATTAGREPAASIFSTFLLIPDHIRTLHSGSQKAFTTPLSPSAVHPAGPLNIKHSFPF